MKVLQIILELLVEDMPRTVRFYKDILGFKVEIAFPEKDPVFVQIGKNNSHIMLYDRSEFEKEVPELKKIKMGGSILLYIKAEKIEEFYKRIQKRATIIQKLHKTDYGSLEFTISDCNGYFIAFSEIVSKEEKT